MSKAGGYRINAASSPFQFTTDTATLCLFDIEALKHPLQLMLR
ncbi:DUF6386 family protein [Paenibacillus kribbensis]